MAWHGVEYGVGCGAVVGWGGVGCVGNGGGLVRGKGVEGCAARCLLCCRPPWPACLMLHAVSTEKCPWSSLGDAPRVPAWGWTDGASAILRHPRFMGLLAHQGEAQRCTCFSPLLLPHFPSTMFPS